MPETRGEQELLDASQSAWDEEQRRPGALPSSKAGVPSSEILVHASRTNRGATVAKLECSSAAAPWRDLVRLERGRKSPIGDELTLLWPTIGVVWAGVGTLEQRLRGGVSQSLPLAPGSVLVYPEGASVFMRMAQSIESTCLQISPRLIALVALDLDQSPKLAVASRPRDEQIERLASLFEAEVNCGCVNGRQYGEHLARALATYLLRSYSGLSAGGRNDHSRSARIAAVQQYIEANPGQELSINELANLAHLSPYHFARFFKQSTGLSPHQYVLKCRIEEGKRLMRQTTLDLAEIAQQLGFRDQSHFTARFRKLTGLTPKRWRSRR
jgi:AraC family transcriptional regulator